MIILPAIDIKDGQCVRLLRGEFGTVHKVAESPKKSAENFISANAEFLHVVDLEEQKVAIQITFPLLPIL